MSDDFPEPPDAALDAFVDQPGEIVEAVPVEPYHLTLPQRSYSLTLPERSYSLTLPDRPDDP